MKYWIAVCEHDAIVFASMYCFSVNELNEKTGWGVVNILPMVHYWIKNPKTENMKFPCDIPFIES